jgi:hypothetical protein
MNLHQRITVELAAQYEAMADAVLVSPSGLAHRVFETFKTGNEEPHVAFACMEHFKHMARVFLARHKDPDAEESEAYAQGNLDFGVSFSGQLQDRYPLPRKVGEEPAYKLRLELTAEERAFNVNALRKAGQARLEHARALEAEGQLIAA